MGGAGDWAFTKRFRRGGFGWRASRLASERIAEALAESGSAVRNGWRRAVSREEAMTLPVVAQAASAQVR